MKERIPVRIPEESGPDLRLVTCGCEVWDPQKVFGPVVRPCWLIFFVKEGSGTFTVGDRTVQLGEGEGMVVLPDVRISCRASEDAPWTCLWAGFSGTQAESLLRDLGLLGDQPTFRSGSGKKLEQTVRTMKDRDFTSVADELSLISCLYAFLATLAGETEPLSASGDDGNYYVRKAAERIRTHYAEPLRIAELASYVNISRGYLYALFMEHLGVSPQGYLTSFRLSRAAGMLTGTTHPVETIAASCGYQDPVVFSKAFKKMYGLSPMKYRQQNRGS